MPYTSTPSPVPPITPTSPSLAVYINDGDIYVHVELLNDKSSAILELPSDVVDELIYVSDNTLSFDLTDLPGVTTVTLPSETMISFANAGLAMEFKFIQGVVTFDAEVAYSIGQQATAANVSISIVEIAIDDLPALSINDAVVYSITISSGNYQLITKLDGLVTISIPYTGQTPVAVWYLNNDGSLEMLASSFNEDSKIITFATTQLGIFVIGYNNVDLMVMASEPILTRAIRFAIGDTTYSVAGVTHINDVAPFIDPLYDRTMVPLRAVSYALNAQVEWESETRTALIFLGADSLALNMNTPLPNGMGMPVIINDRTFVPTRYVVEILGAEVYWDSVNRAVYIYQ